MEENCGGIKKMRTARIFFLPSQKKFRPHGSRFLRTRKNIAPPVQSSIEECSNTLQSLTGPHHINVSSWPDNEWEDRNNAVIRCAREPQEPLPRVTRRTKLVGFCCGSPDIGATAGRSETRVDSVVIARLDRPDLPSKRKCVGKKRKHTQ